MAQRQGGQPQENQLTNQLKRAGISRVGHFRLTQATRNQTHGNLSHQKEIRRLSSTEVTNYRLHIRLPIKIYQQTKTSHSK